jgi:hypothetical protein
MAPTIILRALRTSSRRTTNKKYPTRMYYTFFGLFRGYKYS